MSKTIKSLFEEGPVDIDKIVMKNQEYKEAVRASVEARSKLDAVLDKRGGELLERYLSTKSHVTYIESCEYFAEGFRLGSQLIFEALSEKK